ncbi:hypothetical protein F3087_45000 [Nocardia colli]|uniref:DUF4913 domain-containing protein n=1 Tax=Nocardia colli TaxID=2545717 RepID=A0A5N0DMR7_9NOCA|nr:hypothetical protein [Nocardia colli]KAA8877334.1 hypothetical protein F3087_45000 [Nocardia colli]
MPQYFPCRYSWRHLDRGEAAALWQELLDWVDWLRNTYQLGSRIPSCWFRHDSVREELTALMGAHAAAYYCERESTELPREDMTAWHTQWLWPTVERLTKISDFSACQPHHCRYTRQPQPTHDGLAEYVTDHLDHHYDTHHSAP